MIRAYLKDWSIALISLWTLLLLLLNLIDDDLRIAIIKIFHEEVVLLKLVLQIGRLITVDSIGWKHLIYEVAILAHFIDLLSKIRFKMI